MARITSFSEFWPYYLGEHRLPLDRVLHFIGTSVFFVAVVAAVVLEPLQTLPALAVMVGLGAVGFWMESRRSSAPLLLAMIGVAALALPWFVLAAVVHAYAWAWVGHFVVEKNRPATFTYPLWSVLGDYRMWGYMCTGRLWTGDSVDASEPSQVEQHA